MNIHAQRFLVTFIFTNLMLIGAATTVAQEQNPMTVKLSPQHEILKQDVGVWDVKMKLWMAGPNAEPMESTGTETNRLIGDGAWLVSDFESSFGPQSFTGHGQFGYDSVKKKFVGTWIDSASTHMSFMEGTYNPQTKTMAMTSKGYNEQMGGEMNSRTVTQYKDDGSHVMEMYTVGPGGNEMKTMELHYTKKGQ